MPAKLSGQQLVTIELLQVDLDDIGQQQQRTPAFDLVREVVDGEHEAVTLEFGAALYDFGRDIDRLQHFEHDLVGRQQLGQIREQEVGVAVDEALVRPQRLVDAELAEGMGNHAGRRGQVVAYVGRIGCAVAEQELIGKELLPAIKDRLAAEKNGIAGLAHSS